MQQANNRYLIHYLFQKLKCTRNDEFNHYTNIYYHAAIGSTFWLILDLSILRNFLGTSTADPSSIWWKELMIFWYFNSWGWGGLEPWMTLLETPRFELQCSWHVTTTKQQQKKKIITVIIIMIVSEGRLIKLTDKDNSSPAQKNKNTTIFTFHY